MTSFQAALILATLLCSLVAGFLFEFAAVVMPGIRGLNDGGFIFTRNSPPTGLPALS